MKMVDEQRTFKLVGRAKSLMFESFQKGELNWIHHRNVVGERLIRVPNESAFRDEIENGISSSANIL